MNINVRQGVAVKDLPDDLVRGQPDRLRPLALERPEAGPRRTVCPRRLAAAGAPQASCGCESIWALTTDWITSLPNSLRSSHRENSASRASVWGRSRPSPRSGWDRMSLWAIVFPFVEYLGTDDSRRWPSLASYTTTARYWKNVVRKRISLSE